MVAGRRHARGPELDVREVLLDVAAALHEERPPLDVAGDRGRAVELGCHSDVDQVEDGRPEAGAGRPVVGVEMARELTDQRRHQPGGTGRWEAPPNERRQLARPPRAEPLGGR